MVAPLFGVELAHARESVEVVGLPTVNDPGAVGAVATWTEVVAVLVPFAFVAVRVKTVEVERGPVTVLVPETVPIMGLIESDVAPETVQLKVEVPFRATGFGEALKAMMEGVMPESVVAEALVEEAETLPTLSCAVTSYQ
jgi:hypothetical protein